MPVGNAVATRSQYARRAGFPWLSLRRSSRQRGTSHLANVDVHQTPERPLYPRLRGWGGVEGLSGAYGSL